MDKEEQYDVIIVGSGLSGLHAALPLVLNQKKVLMLDVGFTESVSLDEGGLEDFIDTRNTNPDQHTIFLGANFSGIGAQKESSGHANFMTSGRREFVQHQTETYQPTESHGVQITHSLARGGLSEAWGAVCGIFNEDECNNVGLPYNEILEHYHAVIAHIGVSGTSFPDLQTPCTIDSNHQQIFATYLKKRSVFEKEKFYLEQPPLALLTQDLEGRMKSQYRDMDFWDNIGRSVYRGHYTLEKLLTHDNFLYRNNFLVKEVQEDDTNVTATGIDISTKKTISYKGKVLMLAAGAINTNRIILKSLNLYGMERPVFLKSNVLIPCIQPTFLGKVADRKKHSLCQLSMSSDKGTALSDSTFTQFYSYNSLLLFKLLRFIPLPATEALSLLSILSPALILADFRQSTYDASATLQLSKKGSLDALKISSTQETRAKRVHQKMLLRKNKMLFRALGLIPLKTVINKPGSASHYAGGIPFDPDQMETLGVDTNGKLHNKKRTYIADTATWRGLPAKPPALTIMANARRIGVHIRDNFNF